MYRPSSYHPVPFSRSKRQVRPPLQVYSSLINCVIPDSTCLLDGPFLSSAARSSGEMQNTSIALLPLASRQAARPTPPVYQQVRQPKTGPSARRLQQKNVLPCVLIALGLLCCSVSAFVLSSIFLFDTVAPTTLVLPTTHGGQSQIVQLVDDARLREIVSQTGGRYFVRDWPLYVPSSRVSTATCP